MPTENNIMFAPFQLNIEGMVSWVYTHLTGYNAIGLQESVSNWWYVFSIISFILSSLLLVGVVYAMIRFSELRQIEDAGLREAEQAYRQARMTQEDNSRWQSVMAHASSESPNDWRVAIMEADIMLEELLNSLGYSGSTIADKLKIANPRAFRSIEDAWSAHKVRNAVAHRGSDFVLTKRATQETITQYQHVFEEFKVL